ncbi:TVP38/TMEM64 family protein [Salinilacihabitans rarus]|uniref:TVP38/TMEM64 family protein n=1 Tax=Salinilacihabitans rarus TaxID=2961596 RepID=UPI0020C8A38F|nr:VTT domain-containing protein [Salinilacihabitans rarus]
MAPSLPSRRFVAAALVGVVLAANLVASPAATFATVESLADDPLRFGLLVAALYLLRPLFAWPTTPLAAVVGFGYGAILGVPVALAGVLATVTPVFVVAGRLAADPVAPDAASRDLPSGPVAGRLEAAGDVARRYYDAAGPIRGVTASRLAPIPSDVATVAAAASDVSIGQFLVGTAVGELPWTVAAVAVGASASTIATDGVGDLGTSLAAACAFAAALLLAGPAYRVARTRLSESG